jgi:integrase
MMFTDFVRTKFLPEHVTAMRLAGRAHYLAILKHILAPEEVDGMFQVDPEKSKARLKALPDWPYLSNVRLHDVGPDHVERLILAAMKRGYSTQTVLHIRNVISAIYLHARREHLFPGDNPAKMVLLPKLTHKNTRLLSQTQAKAVLGLMRYPEREIALITMLTRMNIAEICGLQWKYVNLTGVWSSADGEPIPPISIAVRRRWYRGEMDNVKDSRSRNLSIPGLLLPILLRISGRRMYSGPDDFVLVSRTGTPVNPNNIAERRLRSIGKALHIPWLSWNVFRHCSMASDAESETHLYFLLATKVYAGESQDTETHGTRGDYPLVKQAPAKSIRDLLMEERSIVTRKPRTR